jgi:hypothetical protein
MFKTTEQILNSPWEDIEPLIKNQTLSWDKLPPQIYWDYNKDLTIDDIKLWETIYYDGGGIGIYAAWSPDAEFYVIVHNLYANLPNGYKTFYGAGAGNQVKQQALEYGIDLEINKVWVEKDQLWLHTGKHQIV